MTLSRHVEGPAFTAGFCCKLALTACSHSKRSQQAVTASGLTKLPLLAPSTLPDDFTSNRWSSYAALAPATQQGLTPKRVKERTRGGALWAGVTKRVARRFGRG
eukprot:3290362-Pleurochrysis_carterae.AAC.3